jgi:hypothetical protein
MDTAGVYVLPRAEDSFETGLREIDVAIAMVTSGSAVRIRLAGLTDVDTIAPIALARAQASAIRFRVDRGAATSLTFGPPD